MYPVLFIGHGSPLNAIEDNFFTQGWKDIASKIAKPRTILSISAHWKTRGTKIHSRKNPRTIYDFYYFPKELYDVKYSPLGSRDYAIKLNKLIPGSILDQTWGIDHGTWSVLNVMYPEQDVKVFQMSIDRNLSPSEHFELGKILKELRNEVLIIGSGNVVHNLRKADFSLEVPYTWAEKYDDFIHDSIINKTYDKIINYDKLPESALAIPSSEHFEPLLYVLGALGESDEVQVFNKATSFGSVSMTSYLFTNKEAKKFQV